MVRRRNCNGSHFESLEDRVLLDAVTIFSNVNRFLDGTISSAGAVLTPSALMIDSFEDMTATAANWTFSGVTAVQSALTPLTGALLQLTFTGTSNSANYIKGTMYWGDTSSDALSAWASEVMWNDSLQLDVYNPQGTVVTLNMTMGTAPPAKTFTFSLQPGANHLTLNTKDMIDNVYRADTVLQHTTIKVGNSGTTVLYFDNVHWVGPGMGQNLIQYGKTFDCGWDANWTSTMPPEYNRPYFNQLGATTPYTAAKGWGWQAPATQEFTYSQGVMQSSGASGRQPHDAVLRNYLSDISSPLLVDLPNGTYHIQFVEGNIMQADGTNNPLDYDLSIVANGQTIPIRSGAQTFADRAKWFYGHDQIDYMPGMDYFSAYMGNRFKPYECDVTVTGGQLNLQFLTNPVNRANLDFLIIYPTSKTSVIEPELAAFWQDMARRYDTMEYKQANATVATQYNLPGLHDELSNPTAAATREAALKAAPQNTDGLITFSRDTADDVYADTVPNVSDITSSVSATGPQGIITSMALNLHATTAMQNIQVSLGTFTGPGGATIPSSNVSLKFVQYIERMSGQNVHGDWTFMVMPWYLVDRTSTNLAAAMSERYWLNVNVPTNATPGTYTTTATVSANGVTPHQVTLSLTVQPFTLDAVPSNVEYSTIWSVGQEWTTIPDADFYSASTHMDSSKTTAFATMLRDNMFTRIRAEFSLMKNYGLNLVYDSGHNEISIVSLSLPSDITSIISKTDIANTSSRHFATSTQMGTLPSITAANVQAIRTQYGSCIMSCKPADWSNNQEEYGIYRFMGGFMMWRYGGTGVNFDQWNNNWADPYNPFDGHSGEWGSLATPASTNWPTENSSVELEGVREGITDYRYLVTLQNLITAHPGTQAATNAQNYLTTLSNSINTSASYYWSTATDTYGGWDSTYNQTANAWKATNYNAARSQIASLITAFVGVNSPPAASSGGPYVVAQNYPVTLDGSASSDPDGDTLTYAWDINGDGVYTDAAGVRPTLTPTQLTNLGVVPGVINNIRVQVGDGQGHVTISSAAKLTLLWAGDATADGKVDYQDYINLEYNFGTNGPGWSYSDYNNDGHVDYHDYIVLEQNFGKFFSLSAPTQLAVQTSLGSGLIGPLAPVTSGASSQASPNTDLLAPRTASTVKPVGPNARAGLYIDLLGSVN